MLVATPRKRGTYPTIPYPLLNDPLPFYYAYNDMYMCPCVNSRAVFDPIADARETAARRAREEAEAVATQRVKDAQIKKEVDVRAVSARERYLARKAAAANK
jgi:hypothetical protein